MARRASAPRIPKGPARATILTVTHNSRATIDACLRAVASSQGPFEIIVIDNASTDGTPDHLRTHHPHVRVEVGANIGFGAGNNKGARLATAPVLVFLNPDTVPHPGSLDALLAAVQPGRSVAAATIVLAGDTQRLNTAGHLPHFTGFGATNGFRRERAAARAGAVPGVSGAAFAIGREDFQRLGGFDEQLFLYGEDTELSWRLNAAGLECRLVPEAVIEHHYGFRMTAQKLGDLQRARILTLRRHLRWYDWLLYAPSLFLTGVLAWLLAFRFGFKGIGAKVRGSWRGWRARLDSVPRPRRISPKRFAVRRIPFESISESRLVRFFGAFFNAVFLLNTLTWPRRRSGEIP